MAELMDLERWFSVERLTPDVRARPDLSSKAADLYAWNAEVGAAFWRTLGHVEVLLRNAINGRLEDWSTRMYGDAWWYLALSHLFDRRTRADIDEARRRATRTGRSETVGRVVAELNFGFWRYLVASRYDRSLWRTILFRAFPGTSRREVERHLAALHLLRNRIAHHEPIHLLDLAELRVLTLALASWVDAGAATWIAGGDSVGRLLRARP
ncbi:MAG: hypothetical protein ACRDP6_00950 [Actinoallomurus sp.]